MLLQKQPNNWSCLPTAFAITIDIDVINLFKMIGHDGSQIVWPHLKEPMCRRSFHIQEIISAIYTIGYLTTPFETDPKCAPDGEDFQTITINFKEGNHYRIQNIIEGRKGVLIGAINKRPHAVAWDGNIIYDPNGSTYSASLFDVREFWLTTKY